MLKDMGKTFMHCGEPGSGEIAKIVNNQILGCHMIAVGEGFALGTKLGMDPKMLQQVLQAGSAACRCTEAFCPAPGTVEVAPSSRNYEGGFQTELISKDMNLALTLAKENDVKLDYSKHADDFY